MGKLKWVQLKEHRGGVYSGQMNASFQQHGKGSAITKVGAILEGYFNTDKFVYGRKTHTEGNGITEGPFNDANAHGWCIQTLANGNRKEGHLENGNREGAFTIFYPNGNRELVNYN